jgi:hypothetical protein
MLYLLNVARDSLILVRAFSSNPHLGLRRLCLMNGRVSVFGAEPPRNSEDAPSETRQVTSGDNSHDDLILDEEASTYHNSR